MMEYYIGFSALVGRAVAFIAAFLKKEITSPLAAQPQKDRDN